MNRLQLLDRVVDAVRKARSVRIDFNSNCSSKSRHSIVQFNGGQINGEDELDFLQKIKARTNVNYTVKVIQEASSYEIICY